MSTTAPPELRSVRDWLRYALTRLNETDVACGHGFVEPFDEAVYLVCHTLQLPHERLELFLDARLTAAEAARLADLLQQRCAERVPLAYLTGEAWLGPYRFRCDRRALVPRSFIAALLDTDPLADDGYDRLEATVDRPWLEDSARIVQVLDLCTGSGCLAIVAAHTFPDALVDAVDLSPEALALAAENVADHGLETRIELLQGDLFAPVAGRRYDLIVCNPPYVDALAMAELPAEYRHEPELGLAAGDDGMDLVRRILRDASAHLQSRGWLLVEVGERRETVEALWPDIPLLWPMTPAGDGVVFAVSASALAAAQRAGQV